MADTPLARAARLWRARPGDDRARLAFFEALSGAELVLPLSGEGEGDSVEPETADLGGIPHVIAHDGPAALSGPVRPTATLSGLALAQMLAGQGAGVALRLSGGEEIAVSPEALDWLARHLAAGPERAEARPRTVFPPRGLPPALLSALDRRLAGAQGLAAAAWLAAVEWEDGTRGHLLAVEGARPGAEEAIAASVHAAVALSDAGGVRLDVTFLPAGAPVLARLARVGLRFDLAPPDERPAAPPRLR
ncbi:SseB family protein [Rubellimicrobium sp. CFH 75288]|uniref:SseB family protein n=1 Tax=Rubellimicrobium sp. CFH 75288 TaxID=2697034 RepID=UPI001412ABB2|nr:SseB family protein [Rubellimicrobium sp. CFH 75288]NAZ36452.1 SseB family protein [Rubellimicrobium sp. CFH 75288]